VLVAREAFWVMELGAVVSNLHEAQKLPVVTGDFQQVVGAFGTRHMSPLSKYVSDKANRGVRVGCLPKNLMVFMNRYDTGEGRRNSDASGRFAYSQGLLSVFLWGFVLSTDHRPTDGYLIWWLDSKSTHFIDVYLLRLLVCDHCAGFFSGSVLKALWAGLYAVWTAGVFTVSYLLFPSSSDWPRVRLVTIPNTFPRSVTALVG